jgi:hypothetical protein
LANLFSAGGRPTPKTHRKWTKLTETVRAPTGAPSWFARCKKVLKKRIMRVVSPHFLLGPWQKTSCLGGKRAARQNLFRSKILVIFCAAKKRLLLCASHGSLWGGKAFFLDRHWLATRHVGVQLVVCSSQHAGSHERGGSVRVVCQHEDEGKKASPAHVQSSVTLPPRSIPISLVA